MTGAATTLEPGEASQLVREHFTKERLRKLGDHLGVRVEKMLGCGAWGCAYETSNPALVLKVSGLDSEARLWRSLDALSLPGLPFVADTAEISTAVGPFSAVLREGLRMPPPENANLWNLLEQYGTAAFTYWDNLVTGYAPEDATKLIDDMAETAHAVASLSKTTAALGETLAALAMMEAPIYDLHPGNIGVREHAEFGRPGEVLIADPMSYADLPESQDPLVINEGSPAATLKSLMARQAASVVKEEKKAQRELRTTGRVRREYGEYGVELVPDGERFLVRIYRSRALIGRHWEPDFRRANALMRQLVGMLPYAEVWH